MSPRERRAVQIGGALILASFVLLRAVPLAGRAAARAHDDVDAKLERVTRLRADVGQLEALEDSGRVVRAAVAALASMLVASGSEAEALMQVTGRLDAAASRNRVRIDRSDQVPDSMAAGRLRRLTVRITLESDLEGVTGLLRELESGDAVLLVRELRVTASDPASPATGAEVLRAEADISGWYLPKPSTSKGLP